MRTDKKSGKSKVIATFITDKTKFYIKLLFPSFCVKTVFLCIMQPCIAFYFASSFLLMSIIFDKCKQMGIWMSQNGTWSKSFIRFKRDSNHWSTVRLPLWFKRDLKWMKGKGKCRDDKPMLYNESMCQLLDLNNVIVSFEGFTLGLKRYFPCIEVCHAWSLPYHWNDILFEVLKSH